MVDETRLGTGQMMVLTKRRRNGDAVVFDGGDGRRLRLLDHLHAFVDGVERRQSRLLLRPAERVIPMRQPLVLAPFGPSVLEPHLDRSNSLLIANVSVILSS